MLDPDSPTEQAWFISLLAEGRACTPRRQSPSISRHTRARYFDEDLQDALDDQQLYENGARSDEDYTRATTENTLLSLELVIDHSSPAWADPEAVWAMLCAVAAGEAPPDLLGKSPPVTLTIIRAGLRY